MMKELFLLVFSETHLVYWAYPVLVFTYAVRSSKSKIREFIRRIFAETYDFNMRHKGVSSINAYLINIAVCIILTALLTFLTALNQIGFFILIGMPGSLVGLAPSPVAYLKVSLISSILMLTGYIARTLGDLQRENGASNDDPIFTKDQSLKK